MSSMKDLLSEEDVQSLMEDTGLTAEEIRQEYEKAVQKAKSESSEKAAVNRYQRRKQGQRLKHILKTTSSMDVGRPVSERFKELPEETQKELYLDILDRVKQQNEYFERLKEIGNEDVS